MRSEVDRHPGVAGGNVLGERGRRPGGNYGCRRIKVFANCFTDRAGVRLDTRMIMAEGGSDRNDAERE